MQIQIHEDLVGKRLDVAITSEEITRSYAQKLIDDGHVLVNGQSKPKNYKTSLGDCIQVNVPEAIPLDVTAEDIPLDIIYEDQDLLVINKPKGMVVHPAAGHNSGTLVNALMAHCGDSLSGIGGVARPGIVHRIDMDTSGLLIVAKTDKAHIALSDQIKEHNASRIYYAIVLGNITEPITIDRPIGRHPTDRKKMAITAINSKPAITHITPLEWFPGCTFVRCQLETGRTHQIRVHVQSIGHPILGDDVYGRPKDPVEQKYGKELQGQTLHAGEISFTHPITGEPLHFTCPLPSYFEDLLKKLRNATR